MRSTLLLLALALPLVLPPPVFGQTTDRTIDVDPRGRLELHCESGSIRVGTWDRSAVRIAARHDPSVRIEIDQDGPRTLSVVAVTPHGKKTTVEYTVTVPTTLALELSAVYAPIIVEGAGGRVEATNVKGSVEVRGGTDFVEVSSVEGGITLTGTRGRIEASSVNAGIVVTNATGPRVEASTVNGSVQLKDVDSRNVDASTVNGKVTYDGPLHSDGSYSFSSHNGELSIAVPAGTGADVSVSTFSGNFSASFPVSFRQVRGEQSFRFVVGSGGARLELESFNGPIRLRRPGER